MTAHRTVMDTAIQRGTIGILVNGDSGRESVVVENAEIHGPFAIHRSGYGWALTHIASGLAVSGGFANVTPRRVDATRLMRALVDTLARHPGYWEQRPTGQVLLGQLPTTPELRGRHGNAHGTVWAHDAIWIARDLIASRDVADPKYSAAQAKFIAITGRSWAP